MEEFVFRYAFIHLIQPLQISGLRLLLVRRFFTRTCRWSLFVYFFMGFFFCSLYKQTGKIWTSIIAHCGMNTIVIIVQLLLHNGTIQLRKGPSSKRLGPFLLLILLRQSIRCHDVRNKLMFVIRWLSQHFELILQVALLNAQP